MGSSRHSSRMVQTYSCFLVSFGISAGSGKARAKSCFFQPSFSRRTDSGNTLFKAVSNGQQ